MRFLLFNLVVGAAVFYLLTGDPGNAARKAGLSEDAASTIETLSEKARRAVKAGVSETEPAKSAKPSKTSSDAKIEAAQTDSPKTGSKVTTAPKSAPPKSAMPKPAERKPIATKAVAAESTAPRSMAEPRYVETRPVHAAPSARQLAATAPGRPATGEVAPAVAERRAEVLGGQPKSGKITVAGESGLMSPRDRYHELSKLVDDMELVYFNSLGN